MALAMLVMPVALVGLGRVDEFGAGLLFNLTVVALTWLLFEVVARAFPRGTWLALGLYPVLALWCGLVFAHAWFFDVAIERRLTLLDMTCRGAWYFFSVALPTPGLAFFAELALALGLLTLVGSRWVLRCPVWVTLAVTVALGLSSALAVARAPRVPSPLFDSALELGELLVLPRVQVSARVSDVRWLRQLDKSEQTRGVGPPRYRKVIVLVMETMTAANFERESARLPEAGFVARERAHLQRYTRYFPNNQDSRTGMLDMLFSRLVPFEAYDEEAFAQYRQLAKEPSLVDRMHALGYETAFAVSQTALEDVVGELPWSATLHLHEADFAKAAGAKQLCFEPDEYERSCEDLALLPAVLDFVTQHERAFVYQEFVWGHAAAYNEASGKGNAEYYAAYVDALLRALTERGLADDTLLAITSDHGFRDKGRQADAEVYRVPLFFHARDLPALEDDRLFSHTDFGSLLFERLTPLAPRAADNDVVLIVGPTGQGHLFAVQRTGATTLIRRKAGLDLLISRSAAGGHNPGQLLRLFQDYRAQFLARLHR